MQNLENKLKETDILDYNSEIIQRHLQKATHTETTTQGKLIAWYLYVRDTWTYDPFTIYLNREKYVTSDIAQRKSAHCIDKSLIFISGARSMGIPARLHLAKVKNHIAAERIIQKVGTDELAPHGYVDIYFNNKWTKASPIFDKNLCKYLNVDPLDYDGNEDSIFQEYAKDGGRFMEYLEDYGSYDDLPLQRIKEIMMDVYPGYAQKAISEAKDGVIRF